MLKAEAKKTLYFLVASSCFGLWDGYSPRLTLPRLDGEVTILT